MINSSHSSERNFEETKVVNEIALAQSRPRDPFKYRTKVAQLRREIAEKNRVIE
jgi:hypothetical protein